MVFLLIILISVPAYITLISPGFFYTHDGAFHIVRLMHFYDEITRGQFPVRWSEDLAFGYGYPLFNYNYPLLYYIGSLLHYLGLPFGESLKFEIYFFSIGSSAALYYFLRCYFSKYASFVGVIFFIYAPYRFVLTYVTGALGTILALFFVPLILLFSYKVLAGGKVKYLPLLSLALTGLVLSHNATALIFAPLIVGYFCFLIYKNFKNIKKNAFILFISIFLSLGLSSFFLIPALIEKSFVGLGHSLTVNYNDHWPSFKQLVYSPWGYGFSEPGAERDGMSFQIGIAQWAVIILTGALLLIAFFLRKRIRDQYLALFFLAVVLIGIFLMLNISSFIWSSFNLIQQIQFPWRILVVVFFCCSFLVSWIVSKRGGFLLSVILISLLLINNRNYLRSWEVKRYTDDFYKKDYSLYYGSTDIAWENKPIWVKNYPLPKTAQKIEAHDIDIYVLRLRKNERYRAKVVTEGPKVLVLNYFYFPFLGVKVNGRDEIINPSKEGKIEVFVAGGANEIALYLKGTAIEKFSNIVSIISVLILVRFILNLPKIFHPRSTIVFKSSADQR